MNHCPSNSKMLNGKQWHKTIIDTEAAFPRWKSDDWEMLIQIGPAFCCTGKSDIKDYNQIITNKYFPLLLMV